jgi:hypothetical protein
MPDGVNRYVYAANDPVNFTDPMGLSAVALDPIRLAQNTATCQVPDDSVVLS